MPRGERTADGVFPAGALIAGKYREALITGVTWTSAAVGTWNVEVAITDAGGIVENSNTVSFTVQAPSSAPAMQWPWTLGLALMLGTVALFVKKRPGVRLPSL